MTAQTTLVSLIENTRTCGSSAYFGDNPDWLIVATTQREDDCAGESNWVVFQARLRALPSFQAWEDIQPMAIERFSHWAVGWIDYLIIHPEWQDGIELAEQLREKLEDYPVLDESDWSERETDAANQVWKDCYRACERVKYIREHRRQFEFHDFSDMLSCCRGNYFAGYASELLN